MNAIRVETVVEQDGELHLKNIGCRKGDKVEVVVLVREPAVDPAAAEKRREEALQSFLKHAEEFAFRSTGPYPKREELYDRKL